MLSIMNPQHCLETAVLAGEILTKSGAETYRVEETMRYILSVSGFDTAEAFALPTGVFASIATQGTQAITLVKRIDQRGINLSSIAQVNDISRALKANQITMEEAYDQLKQIKTKAYSRMIHHFSTIFLIFGFVLLLNGSLSDAVFSMINGLLLILVFEGARRIDSNPFITTLFASAIVTIGAIFLKKVFPSLNADVITISSMMPLVPGTAITNAIRDTLHGDYMSGSTRALEAIVIAVSIAIGVAVGLSVLGGLL